MDFSIRTATATDLQATLALMRAAMPDAAAPHSEAFWTWKHIASPFGTSPMLLAVDSEDRPVGVRVFSRKVWFCGGDGLSTLRAVDTATHPDWRRRGIFEKLTMSLVEAARAEGAAFIFNTPNDKSRPGYLKMGWQDVGRIRVAALPLRPARLAAKLAAARLKPPSRPVSPFDDDGSIDALFREPGLDPVLAAAQPVDARYHTRRDREYLWWRYREIPGYQYIARWRFRAGAGGIAIARRRERVGLDETTITEVIATPGRAGVSLARKAVIDLCADSPSDIALASAAAGTAEREALSGALFVTAPESLGPPLTVRLLREEPSPSPLAGLSWRASIGDWEIF